jgi:hypothetical protein
MTKPEGPGSGSISRGMYPWIRIRIHPKMSWIRNTWLQHRYGNAVGKVLRLQKYYGYGCSITIAMSREVVWLQEEGYAYGTWSEAAEVILLVLHRKYGCVLGGCLAAEGKNDVGITWRASWACLPDKIYFLQDNGIHFVLGSEGCPLVFLRETSYRQQIPCYELFIKSHPLSLHIFLCHSLKHYSGHLRVTLFYSTSTLFFFCILKPKPIA